MLTEKKLKLMLEPPKSKINMILDTDTFNEIDDQYALAYSILSKEHINLKAVTAAPFLNHLSENPEDGMLKSYDEIFRVLDKFNLSGDGFVYKGADAFLPDRNTPVDSEAARAIIAHARQAQAPLYVSAIGAITNVASAILMEPSIIDNIVVVWLGGNPYYWEQVWEFNLGQDRPAAQVVFDSGVPLVHIPCKNVAEQMRTSLWEIKEFVKGRGEIGDFLYQRFKEHSNDHYGWTKVIWDMTPMAWIINCEWIPTELVPSPVLTEELTWELPPNRHLIRVAKDVRRDPVFKDFFTKLQTCQDGK